MSNGDDHAATLLDAPNMTEGIRQNPIFIGVVVLAILSIAKIGVPIVLAYTASNDCIFRGKVRLNELSY